MHGSGAPSSVAGFVVANLWLVVGVFAFGWDAPFLAVVYWYETVIIGVLALFKIAIAGGVPKSTKERITWALGRVFQTAGYAIAIFFMCTIPGLFVLAMWGANQPDSVPDFPALFLTPLQDDWGAWIALGLFAVGHAYTCAVDYVGRGHYRHLDIREDLKYVPARVGTLFIFVFAGMLVIGFIGAPEYVVIVFVAAKLYADLAVRRRWE